MMEIIKYSPLFSSSLKEWISVYQIDDSLLNEIPEVGFVAKENSMIYAMGFLRRIEACPYAMLDGLIANPKSSGKKRYEALDLIVGKLKQMARLLGLKKMIGQTTESAIIKRSVKHGFEKLPHEVIVVEI